MKKKIDPNWPKLRENCLKLFFDNTPPPKNNWDEKMVVKKTQAFPKIKIGQLGIKEFIKNEKKSKQFQIGRNGETIGQKSILIF